MDKVLIPIAVSRGARVPAYATPGSAGVDLCAAEDADLEPLERRRVWTGLRVAIPLGYEGQVRPRSGLALKHGLGMVNSPGTIDSDYRGEIGIVLINLGREAVHLSAGERIAQLVICPVAHAEFEMSESLEATSRGEAGFGSTGS